MFFKVENFSTFFFVPEFDKLWKKHENLYLPHRSDKCNYQFCYFRSAAMGEYLYKHINSSICTVTSSNGERKTLNSTDSIMVKIKVNFLKIFFYIMVNLFKKETDIKKITESKLFIIEMCTVQDYSLYLSVIS